MKYIKQIEVTDTGMVLAYVRDENKVRKAFDYFDPYLRTAWGIAWAARRAHKWADKMIEVLTKSEYNELR